MSGKGSKPRPFSISHKEYCENWDLIFTQKDKEKHEKKLHHETKHVYPIENQNRISKPE